MNNDIMSDILSTYPPNWAPPSEEMSYTAAEAYGNNNNNNNNSVIISRWSYSSI